MAPNTKSKQMKAQQAMVRSYDIINPAAIRFDVEHLGNDGVKALQQEILGISTGHELTPYLDPKLRSAMIVLIEQAILRRRPPQTTKSEVTL